MRQLLDKVLSAADASADANGPAILAENLFNVSLQAVVTGTSTGTLKLQYSNDIVNPVIPTGTPTNWSDVPSATVSITGAGVFGIAKTDICYQFIRAIFVHTNGAAGTLTAIIKGLGA